MEIFIELATIVISVVALVVSIKALRNQTPKMEIFIEKKKHNAYFGATRIRQDGAEYE